MRIDVEKYLVTGPWSQKDLFFAKAQKLGIAEFISITPSSFEKSDDIETFISALQILRAKVPVKQVMPLDDFGSSLVLARHVVDRNSELDRLREEVRVLSKERDRILPFGDFSLDALLKLEKETKKKAHFFFSKLTLEDPDLIYVSSHYGLNYYFAFLKEPKHFEGAIEMQLDRSLGQVEEAFASAKRKIDEYETELAELSHHKSFLRQGLTNALDRHHLEESKHRVESQLEGNLFMAMVWIPKNKIALFENLANETNVHFEQISVEKEDRVPTYLENKSFSRLGEDLVGIYDTPSTRDHDPSLWVYVAFGLFFSMIIGDAGYGLILLFISLFLYRKYAKKGGLLKRVLVLSTSLSIGCILWGILTASFLGIHLPPDSKWRSLSVIDWATKKKAAYMIANHDQELVQEYPEAKGIKEPLQLLMVKDEKGEYPIDHQFKDNIMMELVLFIGTLHIMLSFLRSLRRNWSGVGWIIFMIGGYLYFPSILKAVSLIHFIFGVPEVMGAKVGLYLIYGGLGLACILAVIQEKLAGLGEIMKVIQVFSDVMSYLRIYALALAGLIMAETFNKMGHQVPIYIGWLIILAGHTVNFTLGIMGGIIHGLRLNFIEWYHYSFEGGGKLLNPLRLTKRI